jgi:hypothetical protein
MRVLVGALAGALFIMAVKSNLLLSTINESPSSLTLLMVLSVVAGASEQLLPNLINRISSVLVGAAQQTEIVVAENATAPKTGSNGAAVRSPSPTKPTDDDKAKNGHEKKVVDPEPLEK